MQMAAKVKGVNYLKGLFFLLFVFCFKTGYSQTGYDKFSRNLGRVLLYPRALIDSCTPAYTNIIIDIDPDGKVADILLSDSAPLQLREKFMLVKGKLKTDLFSDYINAENLRNCGLLIPVFYVFGDAKNYCGNEFNESLIKEQYFKFGLKKYSKPVFMLTPIVNQIYKPVR